MTKDIIGGFFNTIAGYGITLIITLQDINLLIGVIVGAATTIYLICKIIKVIKELRAK